MPQQTQKLATLCYIYKNEKLLLLHRVKKQNDMHAGKYIGIGGKLEPYESPREGMLREIKEEAGITPTDLILRAIIYFQELGNQDKHGALNYLVFVYRATKFEGKIQETYEGEFVWKTIDELMQLSIWEGDKVFVPKIVLEDQFFEAKFIYHPETEDVVEYNIDANKIN